MVKAAHYYGIGPWEVAQRAWHWVQYAEEAQDVEAAAEREREKIEARRKKQPTGG